MLRDIALCLFIVAWWTGPSGMPDLADQLAFSMFWYRWFLVGLGRLILKKTIPQMANNMWSGS